MAPSSPQRSRPASLFSLLTILLLIVGVWEFSRHGRVDAPASPSASASAQTPNAAPPASAPRHDLSVDEAQGGHTLTRHVGRSDADLRERLRRERISAASTYTDRAAAEETVARALAADAARIDAWLERAGSHPNLALDYHGRSSDVVGRSLERGRTDTVPCVDAVVVLRWNGDAGYYVLTTYPEASR